MEEQNIRIKVTLIEKEKLLQEVHHHVQNNLQMVSTLLNLHSHCIEDMNALNLIKECQERIYAIALIHQKLYQNESISSIPMQTYIEALTHQIERAYCSSELTVEINVNAEDVQLDMDTAIPLGIIICELSTNAFKYAFVGKKIGVFNIHLNQKKDGNDHCLSVADNGVGMNNKVKKRGLGTEIIEALIEQLNGTLNVSSSENGTTFTVGFNHI